MRFGKLIKVMLLGAALALPAGSLATSAATVVLLVITAVSIALSVVIADNVEDEVARRYEARAETESQVFTDASQTAQIGPAMRKCSNLASTADALFAPQRGIPGIPSAASPTSASLSAIRASASDRESG